MDAVEKSMTAFGAYAFAIGAWAMLTPNSLLALLFLPPTEEVYIRVVGAIALVLGVYYLNAVKHGLVPFYRISVLGRSLFFVFTLFFVFMGWGPWNIILVGAIDLAGAVWTWRAMKNMELELDL